jgi:hypothetical protein
MTFGPIKVSLGSARGIKFTAEYKMIDSAWLPARFETRPSPTGSFQFSAIHEYTDFKKYRAESTFRVEDGPVKD